ARRRRHDLHQADLSVLAARLRIVIAFYRYNRMGEIGGDAKLTGKSRHDILEFRDIRSSDGWTPATSPATSPPSLLLLARLCRATRLLVGRLDKMCRLGCLEEIVGRLRLMLLACDWHSLFCSLHRRQN